MPTVFPFRILQEHAEKPRFGEPCNNCGLCCRVAPCPIAERFLGCTTGPCTALEIDGGKFYCGMVRRPAYYLGIQHLGPQLETHIQENVRRYLDIGKGCTMDDVVMAVTEGPSENRD